LKFFNLEKPFSETYKVLKKFFCDDDLSRTPTVKWSSSFRSTHTLAEDFEPLVPCHRLKMWKC